MLPDFPPAIDLETKPILRALVNAHKALAELKGRVAGLSNQSVLVNAFVLMESKASSRIEGVVGADDDILLGELSLSEPLPSSAAEVARCGVALKLGYDRMRKMDGIISGGTLIDMFKLLKGREGGFRTAPGTLEQNPLTGEIVYVPPQDSGEIISLMAALVRFINEDESESCDPLVKMALIHGRFESIRPFPSGNGRMGRILNLLFLARSGLQGFPALVLSGRIARSREDYFRLLKAAREGAWKDWLLYMLGIVAAGASDSIALLEDILAAMENAGNRLRAELPKLYSSALLDNLFRHPCTQIELLRGDLGVTRQTAAKYLDSLAEHGFVLKQKCGRGNYYKNVALANLLANDGSVSAEI